ncbi:DUF1642 domain-containing protein [Lapidilactobacillus bayanensis]|uniref:DUF1642 domain-containing protein n=1 Tax=Lapidilactobacillus bayanensis TaxID=2485998 RepID=UPI000F768BF5|nr:DUF1642 domain-containing protein [Lapidilactobacillus bayanensis]
MKDYKVGDTIYVKCTIVQIDENDHEKPCGIKFVDGAYGTQAWPNRSAIIDELPTAEPVKPVLPKDVADEIQQAKDMRLNFYMYIIKFAKDSATCDFALYNCLADVSDEQFKILSDAWYNGYTVEKESRYMVYVPGTNKDFVYCKRGKWSKKGANPETPVTPQSIATWRACKDKDESLFEFTDAEITKFGLQDCEKEEVTDDEL